MRVLVLSGGGLFGAWQAGAWRVACEYFQPDLIVGASIGSVNGYLLAAGAAPEALADLWRDPQFGDFRKLHPTLRALTAHYPLQRPLAIAVTDLLRLKPFLYRDQAITWQHLAASCALPVLLPQVKLDGRWLTDGGLLSPLPLWAAVELGATEILGLNVLAEFPLPFLKPIVQGVRRSAGKKFAAPENIRLRTLAPSQRLGGLRDSMWRKQENIERWLELGGRDAAECFAPAGAHAQKPFPF